MRTESERAAGGPAGPTVDVDTRTPLEVAGIPPARSRPEVHRHVLRGVRKPRDRESSRSSWLTITATGRTERWPSIRPPGRDRQSHRQQSSAPLDSSVAIDLAV